MAVRFELSAAPGIALSAILHVGAAFGLVQLEPPELQRMKTECGNGILEETERCDDGNVDSGDGCSSRCTLEVVFVEAPPKVEEIEVDPPKPVPEPPTEPDPPDPPPKVKPPKVKPPPRKPRPPKADTPPPEPDAPPPPRRFEISSDQLKPGDGTGIVVAGGRRFSPGDSSRGSATGSPSGVQGGTGKKPAAPPRRPAKPSWEPRGALYIARPPSTLRVAEMQCPAVVELGIAGTVRLDVQVRRNGSVRRVKVVKGIGHGCDAIARKALLRAKFKPAVTTDGSTSDYELRYDYVFEEAD